MNFLSIVDFCLFACLIRMLLSVPHLLVPQSSNMVIFLFFWQAPHPHFLESGGLGVLPSSPRSKSRLVTRALPPKACTSSSSGLVRAHPETFPPHPLGLLQRMEGKPGAHLREGRALKNKGERPWEGSESHS